VDLILEVEEEQMDRRKGIAFGLVLIFGIVLNILLELGYVPLPHVPASWGALAVFLSVVAIVAARIIWYP
jgi:hypothetical protein